MILKKIPLFGKYIETDSKKFFLKLQNFGLNLKNDLPYFVVFLYPHLIASLILYKILE